MGELSIGPGLCQCFTVTTGKQFTVPDLSFAISLALNYIAEAYNAISK